MANELLKTQLQAQAIYMNYVIAQASQKATSEAFDPQGRVLVDVKLDENKVLSDINNKLGTEHKSLQDALGRNVTETATVSLDISNNDDLWEKYSEKLAEKGVTKTIRDNLKSLPKGSIIALQQEFHFHLALATRVYQQIPALNEADKRSAMPQAHKEAMREVNSLIMSAYADALKSSADEEGKINLAALNKALDKAREKIAPEAHSILLKKIIEHTGVIPDKKDLKKANDPSFIKHLAEKTTATPNDLLHTDNEGRLATWISGSEETAHNRKKGKEFAERQIITQSFDPDTKQVNLESNNPHLQIRTPSTVVKKGLENDQEYIEDVRDKFNHLREEYHLNERLTGGEANNKPKAIIYNHYTAINDTLGDISGNLQTQSAVHILRGIHRYNAEQHIKHGEDPVFAFVQNISVNGFGDTLSYQTDNALVRESTLMAEVAILHTLYDTASPQQQEQINTVFEHYKTYLDRSGKDRPSFFSDSQQGEDALQLIQDIKKNWPKPMPNTDQDVLTNAKQALGNLMAHDLHMSHDYAKLFQALSVFVEEASIGGCKSGNERAQTINGRVAILESLNNGNAAFEEEKSIRSLLADLATSDQVPQAAKTLKDTMDKLYNQSGLHNAASLISLVDQGASSKVESKPGGVYISRNYAEENQSTITNLHQSKAGKMQAHKGLTKLMAGAVDGHTKSWWARMKSQPLGIVGAVLGTITVFPAVAVAIYAAVDNAQRKSEAGERHTEASKAFNENTPPSSENIRGSYADMMQNDEFKKSVNHTPSETPSHAPEKVEEQKSDHNIKKDETPNVAEPKEGSRNTFGHS